MNTFKPLIVSLCLLFSVNSLAATRYISEEIYTYMHSGPNQSYRIIGTVQVGEAVNTLQYNSESKYTQIKTASGKVGWVKLADLQTELPAKNLLPKVQTELQTAKTKLQNIADENEQILLVKEQSIAEKNQLIASLNSEKQALEMMIKDLEARNLELDLLQDTKDERIKMEWMINGGGVLLIGLLLGLVLPFLPRKKKRKSSW